MFLEVGETPTEDPISDIERALQVEVRLAQDFPMVVEIPDGIHNLFSLLGEAGITVTVVENFTPQL